MIYPKLYALSLTTHTRGAIWMCFICRFSSSEDLSYCTVNSAIPQTGTEEENDQRPPGKEI